MKTGYGTVQRAQQAEATFQEKTAELRSDRAALVAAQRKVDVLNTERGKAEAERDRSQAVAPPGRAQPLLHDDHRAGRRHGRRPLAARRAVRPGRHRS